jgi:hydrogenase nickel incorporation protein HypA/HybF
MHEAALLRDLRGKLLEVAAREAPARLAAVRIRLGALAHLSEATLRSAWPELVRGTPAEHARLEVLVSGDARDPWAASVVLESVGMESEPPSGTGAGPPDPRALSAGTLSE